MAESRTQVAIIARPLFIVFDDGTGTGALGSSRSIEQSPERMRVIVNQVRDSYHAQDAAMLILAMKAAYHYDPTVYHCLQRQYGPILISTEVSYELH